MKVLMRSVIRILSIVTVLVCSPYSSDGQGCNGNLGNNIFEAGDFGSGEDNILLVDPGIAPGYSYRTTPPPPDGTYIITNSLVPWGDRFDWPAINSDNSNDPNGYMMVVNASFDAGIFYEQEIDGLCENTLYVFSADVMNIHPAGRNYIKPNVSFAIDGNVSFQSGDVPENSLWNTYGFTFTTGPGITSVSLSLINNAPGGIGNDLILDNISFQACGPEALILPETVANICEDGSPITLDATLIGDQFEEIHIQWQRSVDEGITWLDIPNATSLAYEHSNLDAGYYYYRYLLAGAAANLQNDKCRVNSNVKVINVIPKFYTVVDTLCEGLTFALGDRVIGESGSFTESLKNTIGCDSIVTLDLTILDDPDIQIDFNITPPSCNGYSDGEIIIDKITNAIQPYVILLDDLLPSENGAQSELTSGVYEYRITDRFGCTADTVVNMIDPILFEVDLGIDQVITLGDTAFIDITSNYPVALYDWNVENINCNNDCMELQFVPLQSLDLGVNATSEAGCTDSDMLTIQVDKLRPVYLPNAFSPDADGINDQFTIFGDQRKIIEVVELEIYDRWAGLIFERTNFLPNDSSLGWDGTYKGVQLRTGTYLYVAHVKFIDNEVIQYSGTVSIIR